MINFFRLLPLLVFVAAAGCARDTETERRAAVIATLAKLRSCLPPTAAETNLHLAVGGVARQAEETTVRLLVLAANEDADFALPAYSLSRGRWLIGERERTYLLDERCREYKLKDRKSINGERLPPDGKLKLKAGAALAVELHFQPLSEAAQLGALVYAERVFPLVFPAAAR